MVDPGRHELIGDGDRRRHHLAVRAAITVLALCTLALAAVIVFRPSFQPGVIGAPVAEDMIIQADRTLAVTRIPANGASVHAHDQEQLIAAIMDDLTTFWTDTLDAQDGLPFQALRGGLTAIDSAARTGSAPCVGSPGHIIGNAFYCPPSDGIIYDSGALVPVLLHRYSIGGLVSTFAHEFGHAVQAQVRTATSEPGETPPDSLLTEAQADCDAGAFLAWVVDGQAAHIQMGPHMVMTAMGPLMDFADPATVDPKDPTAHGLATDRLSWFLTGYTGGAAPCLTMTERTLDNILGRVPAPADGAPRFASRQAVLAEAERSLRAFDPAAPTGSADPALLDAVASYGQFAEATALAVDIGSRVYAEPVGSACFVGAWVGSVYGDAAPLGSWPADVDEALGVMRSLPDTEVEVLAAYLDGFRRGLGACGQ